jgi:thioredoxin-related protein
MRSVAQGRGTTAPASSAAQRTRIVELPQLRDLHADAATSRQNRMPLLLFFDREECPFCERALREYLVPFSRDEWKNRALFRQVEIDRTLPVRDFDGTVTTHQALAARYGISLSPTVLIVDAQGRAMAEPIVGLLTVDFYGAYIQNALADAWARLKS